MDWREAIRRWRALSPEEQLRRRLEAAPRSVARSMAFEGEPVSEKRLQQLHNQWMAERAADSADKANEKEKPDET